MTFQILAFNTTQWRPTSDQFTSLAALLPVADQSRIARFHFEVDRKRALAGALLLRMIVRILLPDIPFENIVIDRTAHGRPFLNHSLAPSTFDMNLSHHGDFAIAAGSTVSCVGIDVSMVEQSHDATAAADFLTVFREGGMVTPNEWTYLSACDWNAWVSREHAFLRVWCVKEAYTKAMGLGVGMDFGTVEVGFQKARQWEGRDGYVEMNEETVTVSIKGIVQEGWYFHVGYLDKFHPFALAVQEGKMMERFCGIERVDTDTMQSSFFMK